MHQIKLHKKVIKFVQSLPPRQQKQIARALVLLQQNTLPQDSKKLQGYAYYRIDCGEYRIIYDWNESIVRVYIIGKRNDGEAYRKLKRTFG